MSSTPAAGGAGNDGNAGILPSVDLAAEAGRGDFYGRAGQSHLAPLWRVLHGLVTDRPNPRCVPAIWRYAQVRPFVMESCGLISTEEAERRVMVLENPGLPGQSRITQSLFAGLQVILPGEVAPAHRHVASALRFVIEGRDAFTAVAGEKTMMEPGDFVITPSMTWHDHGNEGSAPMVWLDGLDMHIVNLLGASFREGYPGKVHPVDRPEGAAMAEAGSNLLPVDQEYGSQTSPIFNYPYARTREALDKLARFRADRPLARPQDELRQPGQRRLGDADDGDLDATAAQGLREPAVPLHRRHRVRGRRGPRQQPGRRPGLRMGAARHLRRPELGHGASTAATSDAVLFSYSDRAVQDKLDLLREERL